MIIIYTALIVISANLKSWPVSICFKKLRKTLKQENSFPFQVMGEFKIIPTKINIINFL